MTNTKFCQGSMAGSAIQATKMAEYEDGLKKGNQSGARNSLQRICTIPEIKAAGLTRVFK